MSVNDSINDRLSEYGEVIPIYYPAKAGNTNQTFLWRNLAGLFQCLKSGRVGFFLFQKLSKKNQ